MAGEATRFKLGHEKKGGIKKGQKQRSTEMVDSLFDFFEGHAEDLGKAWYGLSDKEKWDSFIKALKFMVPAISSVSFEDNKTAKSFRDLMRNIVTNKRE